MDAEVKPQTNFAARFTIAEFRHMCKVDAFGMKIELVDGALERIALPTSRHSAIQSHILFELVHLFSVDQLRPAVGLELGADTVVACDFALLRQPIEENRWLLPDDLDLVVEVSDGALARDINMKRAKYAAANIPTYWVIDGVRSVVHIFAEPVAGDYASISTVRFGAPLAVPGTGRTIVID